MVLYLLVPAAGMLSPLLVIPAITSRFGTAGWTAMALAQSVGTSIGTATEMGWGMVGPQRIAGMSPSERAAQYRLSLASKPLTAVPGIIVAAIVTALLVHEYVVPAAILAAASAAQALSPQWYFIGIGRPIAILWSESVPRVLISIISAIVIVNGAPFIAFSLLMCLAIPLALLMTRFFIGPDSVPRRADWRAGPRTSREQWVMGSGRAIQVVYSGLPVTFVQIAAPWATPVFAATERLTRMSLAVLHSVPARLQSWIGSAPPQEHERRVALAVRICAWMGVVCGIGYAALAPSVSKLVFSGEVDIPYPVAAASGLLLAVLCYAMGLGLAMVATGQANQITHSVIPTAVVAVSTIGLMARWHGPVGAVLAEVAAETIGAIVLLYYLRRAAAEPG